MLAIEEDTVTPVECTDVKFFNQLSSNFFFQNVHWKTKGQMAVVGFTDLFLNLKSSSTQDYSQNKLKARQMDLCFQCMVDRIFLHMGSLVAYTTHPVLSLRNINFQIEC